MMEPDDKLFEWVLDKSPYLDQILKCGKCDYSMTIQYHTDDHDCPCNAICLKCGLAIEINGRWEKKPILKERER